jgi:methionyl-tRNA formyltransferase
MMGTGHFALPTFLGLYETSHQVVGLFTQPDRTGRGHHRPSNPMKRAALEHGTPVFQPERVKSPEALADLRSLQPDLCVVAAYGQILSSDLLQIPRMGAINVHASVLPKYRGAAPVQYAVWHGETVTGVTIFQIEPKLDAGPILGIERTEIAEKETAGELELRLATIAVPLVIRVIDQLEIGVAKHIPQDSEWATTAPRLKKSDAVIDWSKSAEQIGWHIRAMHPWPKPFTFLHQAGGMPLRLIVADVEPSDVTADASPGTILVADGKRLIVQAGDRGVEITRLQPVGKRVMQTAEFLCGHAVHPGDRLSADEA